MSESKEGTSISIEENTIDFHQRSETAALVENKCFVKLSKHLPNISTKEINASLNGCSSNTYGTFESTNSCSPGTDDFCKNDSNCNDNILIIDSTSNHSGGHNMNKASSSSGELPLEQTSSLSNGISAESGETHDTIDENGCTETVQAGPNLTSTLPGQSVLDPANTQIEYKPYESEIQMQAIMTLIQKELSEPYSIYTYRYFIHKWPELCFLAAHMNEYVGAIVCKLDFHANVNRGYIAMLAVKEEYRKMKIGTNLVTKAIEAMLAGNAAEVVLETEARNKAALRLYENLGFVRDRRLFRYYLNGFDAIRLKLWFK